MKVEDFSLKQDTDTIPWRMFTPEKATKEFCVLWIQGWSSSMDSHREGVERMVEATGLVFATLDPAGHGLHTIPMEETTRKQQSEEVMAIYDELVKLGFEKIIVIGGSFGGYLTALLVGKRPVYAAVMRVPANYPDDEFELQYKDTLEKKKDYEAYVAKKYSDNLREEAMKGWAEKLAQGWLPSTPPPGYRTVITNGKKIHEPDPATKAIMQGIFEKYLEPNQSIESIRAELELLGLRTRKGRPFSKSYTQKILTNTFYIGVNHFNGADYPGAQEPIISKELFDKVQRKMRRKLACRYRTHNPIFKNIIRCTTCGKMVTWQLQKGRYYGACQRRTDACKQNVLLREDRLEQQVSSMLQKLVSPRSDVIEWLAEAMKRKHQSAIDENQQLIKSIQTQLDRVLHMDSNLYDDKLAGEISQAFYTQKHAELAEQRKSLEERLQKIDHTLGASLEQRLILLELTQKAAELYGKKSPEKKRLIISKLFEEFSYEGGILSVNYTIFARAIAQNVLETQQLIGERI